MFGSLGWPELIIVLVIVVLVFGMGRITKIGGELGSGIRAFKQGLSGDEEKKDDKSDDSSNSSSDQS